MPDSLLSVLEYFAKVPVSEAKRAADLALLIVHGRRDEQQDRTKEPVPTQRRG